MLNFNEQGGFCSICKSAPTCNYKGRDSQKISYCCEREGYENCEDSVSLALVNIGNIFLPNSNVGGAFGASAKNPATDKGLCKNCESRQTCLFPKPEGGVWHCEEYR